MSRANELRQEVVELLRGRPGWRLEQRTTPGATPLWCYVVGGEIEFSVAVDGKVIRLYVMDTDEEVVFADADELTQWMRAHKAYALHDPPERPDKKTRMKRFFEWE